MTYFHYYATTSRNVDRVLQYGVYPLAQTLGFVLFRNQPLQKRQMLASDFARYMSSGVYAVLTSTFFGLESEMIDANGREAVAAELGVDPKTIKFSDFRHSNNTIINKAYHDILRLQKYRFGTDALFILPTLLRYGYNAANKLGDLNKPWPDSDHISKHPEDYSPLDLFANWHTGWNMSVYAGKAAYWAGETYLINKSGHYEVVKLRENIQSTSKDMKADDLMGVYQRTRTDLGLQMIANDDEASHAAIRPLLEKMAKAYNQHKKGVGRFGVEEIVYLIGLGKVNVHGPDGKTVSKEAIALSEKEIDKVINIGLNGIREENGKLRGMASVGHHRGVVDVVADGAFNFTQKVLNTVRGSKKFHPEELISVRDPGDVISSNYSIHR